MSTRRKIILGIAAALIVAGVTFGIVFREPIGAFVHGIFVREDTEPEPGTPVQAGDRIVTAAQERYDEAAAAAQASGPEAGQAILDDALADTTDKADRSEIYVQKSILAQSPEGGSDSDTAFDYAYQAEEENPTYGTAIYIAELEYYMGDKAKALEYYKAYIERLDDESSELNPGDKEAIEARIAELEASL